jgi:hypothetical protein
LKAYSFLNKLWFVVALLVLFEFISCWTQELRSDSANRPSPERAAIWLSPHLARTHWSTSSPRKRLGDAQTPSALPQPVDYSECERKGQQEVYTCSREEDQKKINEA